MLPELSERPYSSFCIVSLRTAVKRDAPKFYDWLRYKVSICAQSSCLHFKRSMIPFNWGHCSSWAALYSGKAAESSLKSDMLIAFALMTG